MNRIASLLWSSGTAIARRSARGRARLDSRVISIGNLQVGGAGKTPLVAFLAQQAIQRGKSVCILTRGYGSLWEKTGGVVMSGTVPLNAAECGDEIALLHDLVPEAWLGVGADRAAQYSKMVEKMEGRPDLVILDDGFQHHRLEKDLEIVAVTSSRAGDKIFRDFTSALKHAHLVVWTKGASKPETAGRPTVKAGFSVLQAPNDAQKYLLVTGLADGQDARRTLEKAGYLIEKQVTFRDHARYASKTIQAILKQARQNGLKVLLTGKDWVKWRAEVRDPDEVQIVEPTVQMSEADLGIWNQLVWGESK